MRRGLYEPVSPLQCRDAPDRDRVTLWVRATIFAYAMRFPASLGGVIAAAALAASAASAEPIPGPPLGASASEQAGAFCPAPASSAGNVAGFAIGLAFVAIAARRRGSRA